MRSETSSTESVSKPLSGKISVIMPCYNAESYLREAIESVLQQTFSDVELIVVDDGSTDASAEILREYEDRIVVLKQVNQGPYPARNLALKHAHGAYVAFLDADDYWTPDALEKLAATMDTYRADIAYCGWQNIGAGAPGAEPYIPPDYSQMDTAAEFLRSCPWPIHAALVRREAIDAVKGFSERCFSTMDFDLWLRLYAHTQRLVRVPEVMAFYRWHDKGQISSVKWRQALDAWRVRRDFARENPRLVACIDPIKLKQLVDGALLSAAYQAYWKRDLGSAHRLFYTALRNGIWRWPDLKYILPSLLPIRLYRALIGFADQRSLRPE